MGVPAIAAVVLAAGAGTRMRSRLPKPLHKLCGKPMICHVLEQLKLLAAHPVVVVVGHQREQIMAALAQDNVSFAVQAQQLGTADAVKAARRALGGFSGTLLVTCADVPLLRAETMLQLIEHHRASGAAATVLTAVMEDPTGYGRIVRSRDGCVEAIVEEKEADEQTRAIRECNAGVYAFEAPQLFAVLDQIEPSQVKGEYYLTDAIHLLRQAGQRVEAFPVDEPDEVMGINTRVDLAKAERICRERIRQRIMLEGVTLIDPDTIIIDADVQIGPDTVIWPGACLLGETKVGQNCTIGPNAYVENSSIGDGTHIRVGSIVRDSSIGTGCTIGPYCHIRESCDIADGVRIGSYTEVKHSTIGEGSRALHFSYIGDATVGRNVNIGAGTVTCNFDGHQKHPTIIEDDAFVGSDCILVAPVRIGRGALLAAGSVITEDVEPGALAVARSRQMQRPGWADRYFGRK